MNKHNDLVIFAISPNMAKELQSALESVIKDMQYVQQKLTNRIRYSDEVVMVNEQAYLLTHILNYQQDKLHRMMEIVNVNYIDKPTAIELYNYYEKLANRYRRYANLLKYRAKKCVNSNTIE